MTTSIPPAPPTGWGVPTRTVAEYHLALAVRQARQAQADVDQAVAAMRDNGASWADVARVLGTTRQSAWRKYGTSTDQDQ